MRPLTRLRHSHLGRWLCASALLCTLASWAQTPASPPPSTPTVAATKTASQPSTPKHDTSDAANAPGSTPWASLSPAQQQALAPLSASWKSLSDAQQRKWIALARSYPTLGATEQARLHSRMVEWAALSPQERSAARLNFAHTKELAGADKAATWEAYQALSPEEKQKLAAKANTRPTGAALTVKPVPQEKLATVPVTRRTPPENRATAIDKALSSTANKSTTKPATTTKPPTTQSTTSASSVAATPATATAVTPAAATASAPTRP